MNPYQAYQTYQSLKQHFSKWSYDCFKYNFKTNSRVDSFEKRRDKYQFYKLSKQPDLINFIVSNIMEHDLSWVGDLLTEEAEKIYLRWLKRNESITYLFSNEIEKLITPFNDNFKVVDGQYPVLYKLYRYREISHESLVIINDVVNFLPYWKKNIQDETIWPNDYLKLIKYRPFIKYDYEKLKKILQGVVN